VRWLVQARAAGAPRAALARAFHEGLAERLAAAALLRARALGLREVALSGGCFQNRLLLEAVAARLEAGGCTPLVHRRVPPGDGGLAVGQAAVAAAQLVARAAPAGEGLDQRAAGAAPAGEVRQAPSLRATPGSESGMSEIESMPSEARNSANSG
jgi:hydrogenase maturation protein HypF